MFACALRPLSLLSLTLVIAISATASPAGESGDADSLAVGEVAAQFKANDHQGRLWSLQKHLGDGPVVVYFYPAAMTGGCTTQACAFRDRESELAKKGITVVGVSGDAVRNLQMFRKRNDLNFTLLSDPDGSIAAKFGVPTRSGGQIRRQFNGEPITLQRGATFARWTFLLDGQGKVIYRNTAVNPKADAEQVLARIADMQNSQ
jgi:peroxiredoxin Q/BCP